MKYDFNEVNNRIGSNCIKWDAVKQAYEDNEIIPLWIADMDFKIANEIIEAIYINIDSSQLFF